jgi:small GTP-binding protein
MDVDVEGSQLKKIFKVLIVGEMGTGKSCLIRQYTKGLFTEFYKATIGVDFAHKDLQWSDTLTVTIQLWDIAGQERQGTLTRVYYQEAVAAFVVFDITRLTTLDNVIDWKKDIDAKVFTSDNKPIPCILLGNKIDLVSGGPWGKTKEEMQAFVEAHGFLQFFETSAKDGTNIDAAAKALIQYILDHGIEPAEEKGLDLNGEGQAKESGCC